MPIGPSSSAVHLQDVNYGSTANPARSLQSVTIHPAALFSILDHFLRRSDRQDRVIGTLLGTRTETEVEVRNCFAVLHSETSEQVAVDMEYHKTMYELHHKVNPKEVIVGWYSTGSNLNTYSALIQNFYSQETGQHAAVHISVNTGAQAGEAPGVKAYISSPVGVTPRPENSVFVPIPCELRFNDADHSGLSLLTEAVSAPNSSTTPSSNLEVLEKSIREVMSMLDRVLGYVKKVIAGEVPGDPAIGRYLMETFGASTEGLDKSGFASSLQDTLMISYLANLMRAQAELSSRLQLVQSV